MDLDAQLAFSIAYQTTVDCPFGLSSIYRRDYWESGVYRILNRTWKPLGEYDENVTMALNPLWTDMMKSQIEWLQENTNDYRASIISRKHPSINSLKHLIKQISKANIGYDFKLYKDRIWVCKNRLNDSCYQDVIYTGEDKAIIQWSNSED